MTDQPAQNVERVEIYPRSNVYTAIVYAALVVSIASSIYVYTMADTLYGGLTSDEEPSRTTEVFNDYEQAFRQN